MTYTRTTARKAIFGISIAIILIVFIIIALMIGFSSGGGGEATIIISAIFAVLFIIASVFIFITWLISLVFKLVQKDTDPFTFWEENFDFIRENKQIVIVCSGLITFSVFALLEDQLKQKKEKELENSNTK